jgi:PAS domain S-box-containing protein
MSDLAAELVAARARIAELEATTAQRNAELAVVNDIGTALLSQSNLQGVLEAVGDRAVEALGVRGLSICLLDPKTEELRFLYWIDDGVRNRSKEGMVLGDPLSGEILRMRRPLRINSAEEAASRGTPFAVGGTESYLGVPIPAGDRAIGVFAIGSRDPHAFDESHARFMSTLASSMGVALENARLVLAQKKSEEEYRDLVEELPLAIYRDRPDNTSTSLYASPKTEEIFGYPVERWMAEGFFDSVVHPDDRERVAGSVGDNLQTSNSKTSFTYRVIAADGRVVWVRDDSWVSRDEAGEPLYINGFMLDITEQVLAEAEIRRQKQYFEALVEISPVAIVTMDRDEVVSGWNPAARTLFGHESGEAIGRHIDELLFSESERSQGAATTLLADETGRAQLIGRRRRKDGALVDVEIVLVPLVIDGEPSGYYAIYHDITELEAARRDADAANEAKSTFLASMSHEIRTPMNAIIGMSGLLVDTKLDEEQRDFAETIRTSAEALLTIINDILDFSKIEAGRLELDSHRFDLAATIEGALDVIGPIAAGKGLELTWSIEPGLSRWYSGDAGRLRQIALNLLSNAVKFTDTGEIAVSLTGRRVGDDGTRPAAWDLSLSITDTGIGIAADRMERLFRSFSQADASISRRYGGTGLGLAISRRLAELMGGSLDAKSSGVPGHGSTFTVAIRLPEDDGPAAEPGEAPSVELVGRRALVVDDNATNLRVLVAQLERLGLVVTSTTSPLEARDLAAGPEQFDVLLTDLQMPELDGIALAKAVRAARPNDTPRVIILSSLGRREREAEAVGAWLAKPVKPAALRETLARVLGARAGAAPEATVATFVADPGLGVRHPLRVLLAEDNTVNQKLALRLLKGMGYEADLAVDGFKVLEALDMAPYDLVLMDVQMPDLDGLEATRRIRQRWPDRPLRIVAMTANAMDGDRETCLDAGMDDYISKPIRPEQLAATLAATPNLVGAGEETSE